jgi:hypothetical protein
MAKQSDEGGALVFIAEIRRDNAVTDRAVRKWIERGFFPEPDGNRLGRNFWHRATYRKWQKGVLRGALSRESALARRHRTQVTATNQ